MTSVKKMKNKIASTSSIEINTLHLEKMNAKKISTKKEQKIIIVKHDSSASIHVIATTARASIKKKTSKRKKSIRKILRRQVEKEKRLSTSKSIRPGNWAPVKMKDCDEKILRESKKMKKMKTIEKRHSRLKKNQFTSSMKKKIKKKMIMKKKENESKNLIKIISKTRRSTRSCIFNLLCIEVSEKKFVKRLKKTKIIFSLKKILIFASLIQKYFEKFLLKKNVLKFRVNNLKMKNVKHEKNFVKSDN